MDSLVDISDSMLKIIATGVESTIVYEISNPRQDTIFKANSPTAEPFIHRIKPETDNKSTQKNVSSVLSSLQDSLIRQRAAAMTLNNDFTLFYGSVLERTINTTKKAFKGCFNSFKSWAMGQFKSFGSWRNEVDQEIDEQEEESEIQFSAFDVLKFLARVYNFYNYVKSLKARYDSIIKFMADNNITFEDIVNDPTKRKIFIKKTVKESIGAIGDTIKYIILNALIPVGMAALKTVFRGLRHFFRKWVTKALQKFALRLGLTLVANAIPIAGQIVYAGVVVYSAVSLAEDLYEGLKDLRDNLTMQIQNFKNSFNSKEAPSLDTSEGVQHYISQLKTMTLAVPDEQLLSFVEDEKTAISKLSKFVYGLIKGIDKIYNQIRLLSSSNNINSYKPFKINKQRNIKKGAATHEIIYERSQTYRNVKGREAQMYEMEQSKIKIGGQEYDLNEVRDQLNNNHVKDLFISMIGWMNEKIDWEEMRFNRIKDMYIGSVEMLEQM